MAYNRWLSGSQTYRQGDVLHYGRKGMKWYKSIFGLPKNLFSKKRIGPSIDIQSLRTLLQRGEIDFNTFKEMTNGVVYRPTSSPSQTVTRKSSQQMRSIGESVGNSVKERKAREDREARSRAIAEEKARMGRQDERQIQANERKTADERHAQHVSEQRAKREQKRQQEARNTAQERKTETQRKREEAPKPTTSPPAPKTEESSDPFATLLTDYITNMANETEEERAKRKEEERKAKEAEERKKKEEEERKKKEKLKRDVEILKKINRVLSFGHMPISP